MQVPRLVSLGAAVAALLAAPAAAAAAPTISGANGDVWNADEPAPTYTVGSTSGAQVQWRLDAGPWSAASASPLVVPLGPVADGDHALAAREATLLGILPSGAPATRRFRVNTTPPRIDLRAPAQGAVYEQGQAVAASYSCTGAVTCAGPVPSGQPIPTGAPGPVTFRVRATDDAGNAATARGDYAVAAPGQATAPGAPGRPAQVIRLAPQPPPRLVLGVPQTLNARRAAPGGGEPRHGAPRPGAALAPAGGRAPLQPADVGRRGRDPAQVPLALPGGGELPGAGRRAVVRPPVRVARLAVPGARHTRRRRWG